MIVTFLRDTQERLTLIASHPDSDDKARHWVERKAMDYLANNEPDSESQVVTAQVIETIEIGDFVMRGPTPAPQQQACRHGGNSIYCPDERAMQSRGQQ